MGRLASRSIATSSTGAPLRTFNDSPPRWRRFSPTRAAPRGGLIDLLGEITGGGKYEDLLPATTALEIYGITCLCLDLAKLIDVKRAAGRPKDFDAIAELEVIAEEKRGLD